LNEIQVLERQAADLVRRAQAGDGRAREELLARCHGMVFRWANMLTRDADDADDVTQEVLITVTRKLHRYHGRSRFTTLLYQVTRNAALSLRRRVTGRLRLITRLQIQPPSDAQDPLDALHASQTAEAVRAMLQALPVRQREVFYLVDVEGHSASEIAPQLGLRPVTVRAHLFRARRALRTRILERFPDLAEERTQ
jgi:RNA polymerase sigma-70 factor (ECF subfamily)